MKELSRLINNSFNAQCKYVMPRIHNKYERGDFFILYKMVSKKISHSEIPVSYDDIVSLVYINDKILFNQKSINMLLEIYKQTYMNLHSRFVTGNPIQPEWVIPQGEANGN